MLEGKEKYNREAPKEDVEKLKLLKGHVKKGQFVTKMRKVFSKDEMSDDLEFVRAKVGDKDDDIEYFSHPADLAPVIVNECRWRLRNGEAASGSRPFRPPCRGIHHEEAALPPSPDWSPWSPLPGCCGATSPRRSSTSGRATPRQPHRHAARPVRPVDQDSAHPRRPHHRPEEGAAARCTCSRSIRWLGYKWGWSLTQREFRERDGVYGDAGKLDGLLLPDGATKMMSRSHVN